MNLRSDVDSADRAIPTYIFMNQQYEIPYKENVEVVEKAAPANSVCMIISLTAMSGYNVYDLHLDEYDCTAVNESVNLTANVWKHFLQFYSICVKPIWSVLQVHTSQHLNSKFTAPKHELVHVYFPDVKIQSVR